MFDRAAWRRECYERYLFGAEEDAEEDELDDAEEAAYWADAEGRGHAYYDEPPMGGLAQMADDIEAGRVDPTSELMPLPDGEAPFRSWAS